MRSKQQKVRIAGYTSVLDGASALRSLSLGHARSTTEVLICQIKWGSKEWDWGGEWHLGSHPWNEKKEKKKPLCSLRPSNIVLFL